MGLPAGCGRFSALTAETRCSGQSPFVPPTVKRRTCRCQDDLHRGYAPGMSDSPTASEGGTERRRARWATFVAVALDLLVPSLFAADASHHEAGSRLAGVTTLLTAGVGALVWFYPPWRSVGVGLVRGSAVVFVFVLVVLPLVVVSASTVGWM